MTSTEIPDLEHDDPAVDELAVDLVAEDGMRMHLRGADRAEAIRRMNGRIEVELIAWRLYITTRTVQRVIARSHATTTELAVDTAA